MFFFTPGMYQYLNNCAVLVFCWQLVSDGNDVVTKVGRCENVLIIYSIVEGKSNTRVQGYR